MSATTLLPPRAWPAPDANAQVGEPPTPPPPPPPPPPAAAEAKAPTTRPTPRWFVPSYVALLVTTAVAYLWGLGASGWANAYYSAAAQAASSSWKAWFFGSFDSANAITVDKPPASLWVMGLSARIFGVNSWSILVPEALMGVATVALLVLIVKRWFHPGAALLAGIVAATTPVAVLMFRFNNPDALLVLLLTAAAYTLMRAIDSPRWRWVLATGALVGFAFLTKMLQAFIVLPAFGVTYLVAASTTFRKRILHLLGLGAATIVAAGWWVLTVELWPASSRPYIGGSQTNSILELIVGYNGLGRLTGNETGSVGGGNGAGRWGATGLLRMFNSSYGGQASWLLPAALVIFAIGMVATWRRPRTDRTRAALLLWGLTLVATAVTFSLGQGIIHEYYTVALVPPIAALVGIGASMAWEHRQHLSARVATASVVALSAWWSYVLLDRTPAWTPWLRVVVIVTGVVGVVGILAAGRRRWMALAAAGVVTAGLLAGPVAYSMDTIDTPHTGSLPTAGPSTGRGPGGMVGGPGGGGGFPGGNGQGQAGQGQTGQPPSFANGQAPSFGGGQVPSAGAQQGGPGAMGSAGGMGGAGGLLNASEPSAELVSALQEDSSQYTWVAAAIGANSAAGYQLATGDPVLAIGGFNGTDDYPSLAEFQQLVADGDIHFFIAGGGFGGGGQGGSQSSSEISSWVQSSFTSTTVGGVTLYDLTSPSST